MIAVFCN